MATQAEADDPLYHLRLSIQNNDNPILTTSPDPTTAEETVEDLALATHIQFNHGDYHKVFDLKTPTRFAPDNNPQDLRTVYFAWVNKDAAVTDYFTAVSNLNEELPNGAGGAVHNLNFMQRVDLYAWLKKETETSDSIEPLDGGAAATAAADDAAAIAGGKGVPVQSHAAGGKQMSDARLLQIYAGERKMGDRNTMLRGSKPTDFSHFRKAAEQFLRSHRSNAKPAPSVPHPTALVSNVQKKPSAPVQPIILISPSASSLLRMSNIKSFLNDGVYVPASTDNTAANLLQVQRTMPAFSSQPMKFNVVDSTAQFKPTYWSRVVAVFTTGQAWQFKSYKYTSPVELFSHYPGVYVGWQGDEEPDNVQSWGRGVLSVKVDKWTGSEKGRWRDREVVERIWGRIEEGMKRNGWTKYGPGLASGPGR